jgi:hypothetical protein
MQVEMASVWGNAIVRAMRIYLDNCSSNWRRVTKGSGLRPETPFTSPAVIAYDEWLRETMHAGFDFVLNEPILKDRYERLMRTSREPFKTMIRMGPTVDQEYEKDGNGD